MKRIPVALALIFFASFLCQDLNAAIDKELLEKTAELLAKKRVLRGLKERIEPNQKAKKVLPTPEEYLHNKSEKLLKAYAEHRDEARTCTMAMGLTTAAMLSVGYAASENFPFLITLPASAVATITGLATLVAGDIWYAHLGLDLEKDKAAILSQELDCRKSKMESKIREYLKKNGII
jgi:hypothetical protein